MEKRREKRLRVLERRRRWMKRGGDDDSNMEKEKERDLS